MAIAGRIRWSFRWSCFHGSVDLLASEPPPLATTYADDVDLVALDKEDDPKDSWLATIQSLPQILARPPAFSGNSTTVGGVLKLCNLGRKLIKPSPGGKWGELLDPANRILKIVLG